MKIRKGEMLEVFDYKPASEWNGLILKSNRDQDVSEMLTVDATISRSNRKFFMFSRILSAAR